MRLQKSRGAQAPTVTGFQAWKAKLRHRRAQVVADIFRIGKELRRHHRANRMAAIVGSAGVAMAIAKEPGDRVRRTLLERAVNYVDRLFGFHALAPCCALPLQT